MGNIPLVVSREGARAPIKDVRGAMSSPDDFGAQIGRATQQLGAQLGTSATNLQTTLKDETDKKRSEGVAIATATDAAALDRTTLEAQRNAPADGKGTAETAWQAHQAQIDQKANERFPDDPDARAKYKQQMTQLAGAQQRQNVAFEYKQEDLKTRTDMSTALDSITNRTRTNPGAYDENLVIADKLIDDSKIIPAGQKEGMKLAFRSQIGEARFDAGLSAARSAEDFDALEAEAKSDKFVKSMDPKTYDRVLNGIKASRNTFQTQEGAKAGAALSSMEARSKDRAIIPEAEMSEMAATLKNAKSPALISRFAEISQQQADLQTYGKQTPAQLKQRETELRAGSTAAAGGAGKYIDIAANVSGLPAGTIAAVFGNEYSASDVAAGKLNEPNKAGASSARGMFQMIDGTFVGTVRANPGLFGDQTGRSDQQILALRNDPENQAKAMGAFTKANVAILQKNGMALTPPNVYMMHFLGAGGGLRFLKALQENPNQDARGAADFSAVSANASVFLKKNGDARTVGEIYDMFANKIIRNTGVTAAAYNRAEYFNNMATEKEKAVKADPITQARADTLIPNTPLSDVNSYSARGAEAMAAANYYSIAPADMKPFTAEEADTLTRKLKEGTADDKLAVLAQIQAMDKSAPGMATAALKQLGESETATGHVAGLSYSGRTEDAAKAMRGMERMDTDKTMGHSFGKAGDVQREFSSVVGSSLDGMTGAQRSAILKAAQGHYLSNSPGYSEVLDTGQFRKSVAAVLGVDSVAEINGAKTIAPPGVQPEKFEAAIEGAFSDQDYAVMSVNGQPPKYRDGSTVPARDIANEGVPVWAGAGTYQMRMADGTYLVSGERDAQGNALKYRFTPTKEHVEAAINRQVAPSPGAAAAAAIPPNTPVAPPPNDGQNYPAPRPRLTDRADRSNPQ